MGRLSTRFDVSLLHFDGQNGGTTFADESGKVWTPHASAALSTTQAKFGATSGYFPGNSYISTPQSSDFDFGNGDFTVDGWIFPTALGESAYSLIWGKGAYQIAIVQINGSYAIKGLLSTNGSSWNLANLVALGTATQNAWNHFAFSRVGSNVYGLLGGVLGSTTSVGTSSVYAASATINIGGNGSANSYVTGYLDEIRALKGKGLYNGAFTPPTRPYRMPVTSILH